MLFVRDVYDSKAHGYRYSRDDRIEETSISCRQPKSLVFLPYIIYNTLLAFVKRSFIISVYLSTKYEY